MMLEPGFASRMQFLVRVVRKEAGHLAATDRRLFAGGFTQEDAVRLESEPDLAERVDAFVGRFSRLQDTVGDKLLPVFLIALGETAGAAIDNLDRAERLGLLDSVDDWMVMRKLRNQMVHEYVEDPTILCSALLAGHAFVPALIGVADRFVAEAGRRGWA
ncbi:hypothetical protein [Aromatoleum diolicum]|uniref:DUF86 domain-containing protein n=1 Tax=Aromatoleum diolicum TaxID=75796 RepID=A0ABX1Q8F2_9RHOO|nr:hypothetical protein [Aromatoleum diolicum]NMG73797.1 hypothetical protein [Aromatoleum diolicum]